jgi:hypothetical protein
MTRRKEKERTKHKTSVHYSPHLVLAFSCLENTHKHYASSKFEYKKKNNV